MRVILACYVSVLFCGALAAGAWAGPVWEVTKGEHRLLIGGTIHLLSEQDYPLPERLQQAYEQADILVFEVNPDDLTAPEAQQALLQHSLYQDGRTLKTVLSPPVYQRLAGFLNDRGLPIGNFMTTKPGMLSMLLTVIELQRLGMAGTGVDVFFSDQAKQAGKPRWQLETLTDQLNLLANLGDGMEDEMVLHTLDEIERLPTFMRDLKAAWRQGDMDELQRVGLDSWMKQFPQVYQALLVARNQRWIPQIDYMLTTPEVEYVLVGVLHMAGPGSVLVMLQARGYQVEPFVP